MNKVVINIGIFLLSFIAVFCSLGYLIIIGYNMDNTLEAMVTVGIVSFICASTVMEIRIFKK